MEIAEQKGLYTECLGMWGVELVEIIPYSIFYHICPTIAQYMLTIICVLYHCYMFRCLNVIHLCTLKLQINKTETAERINNYKNVKLGY
jgi:hypothetical protein